MIEKERQFADGIGERGGGGAKLYDGEKAWSSINQSIFSAHGLLKKRDSLLMGLGEEPNYKTVRKPGSL
jgi:hypothetical protein